MDQYRHYQDNYLVGWGDRRPAGNIRKALAALDLETASVADVDAAIGVPGWGSLCCDLCEADKETLVRIGDEPDYEARWVDVCRECLSDLPAQFDPSEIERAA